MSKVVFDHDAFVRVLEAQGLEGRGDEAVLRVIMAVVSAYTEAMCNDRRQPLTSDDLKILHDSAFAFLGNTGCVKVVPIETCD